MAARRHDYVDDITPAKESWDIVVRIGDKIQTSVRKVMLSFQSKICDGTVYNLKSFGVAANSGAYRTTKHKFKLSLQSGTGIQKHETALLITISPYRLISFLEIVGKIDMDYLIEVVAIVSAVGRERIYERNRVTTKFKVIELDSNGMKLECILFGTYVDALDAFLQTGYIGKVVVLVGCLKVKIDNIGSPTQPFSYIKYAFELSLEEEFLNLSQRKTIEELKDSQNDMVCVVLGTINHFVGGSDWWYAACVYNKGVVVDSKRYSVRLRLRVIGKQVSTSSASAFERSP
ncbi:uncharacterized protein LOC131631967 [Vicia villosa]|uniref:uncharacterized protein LOC131631967 n=1 Tax=Vicia villosa TaxID=3911 RepID=UPI00273C4AF0|nr:uncharacterized protein LOC131631967 [Vicia villosa]